MSKGARLAEFLRLLQAAPPARSFDEAYGQLSRILNEVEDRLSGVPYNIRKSLTDGRLYPPLWDRIEPEGSQVRLLRSVRHHTLIGDNGSIEIMNPPANRLELDKAGEDGRKVSEL